MSQGEIERSEDVLVDALFARGPDIALPPSGLRRPDYVQRALRGGYPEAVRRTDLGRRARFFESYISDLINRDVRQVTEIERPDDMRRLLNIVAAQMATLAVPGALANALQLSASTRKRYLDLLDLLFVVRRVPAWSTNLTTRAVATPKLVVTDTGLAAHLAGVTTALPLRDRDGHEVDAILEHASGDVVAIEVKAAETVRAEDFRGIQGLARRLGDRLLAGVVLYAGGQALPFGDRLRALPISALWTV